MVTAVVTVPFLPCLHVVVTAVVTAPFLLPFVHVTAVVTVPFLLHTPHSLSFAYICSYSLQRKPSQYRHDTVTLTPIALAGYRI